MRQYKKVTDAELAEAVASSVSWYGVLRNLDIRLTGGSNSYYKARAGKLGIDSSHFTGRAHNRGKAGINKRAADSILVKRQNGARAKSNQLVRALIETGRPHCCGKCGQSPEWQGNPLTLDVDHINEDWLDDRAENLRFLCPNCHSQFSRGLLSQPKAKLPRVLKQKIKIPRKTKIDWGKYDVVKLVEVDKMPMTRIGEMLGVSDNAVRKHYRKLKRACGEISYTRCA